MSLLGIFFSDASHPEQRLQTATMLPGSRSSDVSEISIQSIHIVHGRVTFSRDVNRFEPLMRLMRLSDGSSSVFLMVHKRRIPRFRLQVILWLDSNLARKHERLQERLHIIDITSQQFALLSLLSRPESSTDTEDMRIMRPRS